MKDIVWSDVLRIEIDEIDEDHRKLISIFNILNHSLTEGDSPEYLRAVLEELINCTVWHFSHEERLMLKHGDEGLERHKAVHRNLIRSARELQHKILNGDRTMGDEEIEYLERWLTEHILTEDMRMAEHLSQVM